MVLRCAAYLRVSTEEQDNGVAIERMMFDVGLALESIGGELLPEHILTDKMSGKRNDRPNFQKLVALIESRAIDCVIFNKVDRLGRDTEKLMWLSKLLQRHGVRAYACDRNKSLDFNNLDDWDFWTGASVQAERESRVISARVSKAHAFSRHKRQAAFKSPYGYRRGVDRQYEWHPDQIDNARRMVAIVEGSRGNLAAACRQILDELGLTWTRRGLGFWIDNLVLRGHTPQLGEVAYNTHSGVQPDGGYDVTQDLRILTEDQHRAIQQQMRDRAKYRGANAHKELYPLTGLCRCACGAPATISKHRPCAKTRNYKTYQYIRCRAGEGSYLAYPKHRSLCLDYELVEKTVIDYLVAHADRLIAVVARGQQETAPNPAIVERQQNIDALQAVVQQYGDPGGNLTGAIARLQLEIAELSRVPESAGQQELRDRLCGLRDRRLWYGTTRQELRSHFVAFVEQIVIDFECRKIAVSLNPLIRL